MGMPGQGTRGGARDSGAEDVREAVSRLETLARPESPGCEDGPGCGPGTPAGAGRRGKEGRLSFEEWCALLSGPSTASGPAYVPTFSIPDAELLRLADRFRAALHPDAVVTYVVDRNISYTNVCTSICDFCGFSRRPGEEGGYVLSRDEVFRKVEETMELGGSGILLEGGLHPDLPLEWYTSLLRDLKRRYGIHLQCFSPPEILGLSEVAGLSPREVLIALREAGMDSLPGGGAEILVDDTRLKHRSKVRSGEWLEIMETAHELGIPTTATMMLGHGETAVDRLRHLEEIRKLQDRTGGFLAFMPGTLQPEDTPRGQTFPDRVNACEYLRWLAVSRLYLDNVPNLQVSSGTEGIEVGRQGLRAGANDLGSTLIEERNRRPPDGRSEATEEAFRRAATEEGFIPVVRNAAFVRLLRKRRPGDWDPWPELE